MLRLLFLGAFQASLQNQPPLQFQTNKVRALLAYLAVEPARTHPRATLAGLLWPEMPEANARNNLSKALGMLRQALGDREHPNLYLDVHHRHVRFNPDGDYWLDVAEFQQKTARQATDAQLLKAVDLYQGEFLSGFSLPDAAAFEEWLLLWRERLHQQMLAALARLTTRLLDRGQPEQALPYARRQLELDAWREAAHAQLMQALALAGKRSEALAHFDLCRSLLVEELGVAPAPETVALYEAIKDGQVTPLQGKRAPAHNLPALQTPFIGRRQELATLDELVRQPDSPLATLVGPGGQGKTRLILAYARQLLEEVPISPFPDGIYFVSLSGVDAATGTAATEEQFLQAIATALPLSLAARSRNDARPPQQQVLDYLQQKQLLLLLDNLDPFLVQATDPAGLIAAILKAAPHVQIIATAREPLGLYGERVLPLAGLSLPAPGAGAPTELAGVDAVELFLLAARRLRPEFRPHGDEWVALGQLCHFLGGLPLAIELAASWTEVMPIAAILAGLQQDLGLLRADLEGVAPRHRSVRRVLEHTWQQLGTEERQVLAALSVSRGGFSRDAAQAVARPDGMGRPDALRLLRKLVQRSLIAYDRARDRYDLHELLRTFARERLAQDARLEATTLDRHTAFYCALLQTAATALTGSRQQMALAELELEFDNVRQAWRRAVTQGEVTRVAAALEGLFHLCDVRSRFRDGEQLMQEAVAGLAVAPAGREWAITRARLQARAGWFAFHLGRPEEAIERLQESLSSLQQAGAEADAIFNYNYLGAVYRHQGLYDGADGVLHEALRLARAHDDAFQASISLNILGQTASLQGDYDAARSYCEEALAIKRALGDRRGMTYSLTYLGRVALAQEDYAAAEALFAESLAISEALGDRRGVAFAARNLGQVAQEQADYAEAERRYAQGLAISHEVGNRLEAALCLIRRSQAATAAGNVGPAREYVRQGIEEALSVDSQRGALEGLFALAQYGLRTGHPAEALACLAAIACAPQAGPALQARASRLAQAQEGTTANVSDLASPTSDLASLVTASMRRLT